jgi:preprotein translocase subunit SecE
LGRVAVAAHHDFRRFCGTIAPDVLRRKQGMAKAIAVTETQMTPQWRQQPERFLNFLKEVRSELHKVVTPSRKEVQSTTTVVIITVFMFAGYFWLVDTVFNRMIQTLLAWLTH